LVAPIAPDIQRSSNVPETFTLRVCDSATPAISFRCVTVRRAVPLGRDTVPRHFHFGDLRLWWPTGLTRPRTGHAPRSVLG